MSTERSALFSKKTPGGVYTISDIRQVAGTVFFVDSSASNASDAGGVGTNPDTPFATIDYAIGQCSANQGDTIVVLPGHAETTTAAITLDVAGVSIIGQGIGNARPAITANFSSAGDTLTITAANCLVENIRFVASSASQNAQINVAAANTHLRKLVVEQGANNLIGVTLASGDAPVFEDCIFLGTANGPDVAIDFEAGIDNFVIKNCRFNFGKAGIDLGVIRASDKTVEGGLIQDCQMLGVDTVAIDFNSSAGATGDGLVERCSFVASAPLTSIEDIIDVGGYNFAECYAVDVATGRAAPVPISTVS